MMRMKMKRLGAENFADPMRKRRVMMMMMDPELSMMGGEKQWLWAVQNLRAVTGTCHLRWAIFCGIIHSLPF